MGYYTRFELKAEPVASLRAPEDAVADLVRDDEDARYCLQPNGGSSERGKWYDHEETLKEHSKKHPHLVFTLTGEGEENDDIWAKYFCNGRVQVEKADIQVAAFDPERLE